MIAFDRRTVPPSLVTREPCRLFLSLVLFSSLSTRGSRKNLSARVSMMIRSSDTTPLVLDQVTPDEAYVSLSPPSSRLSCLTRSLSLSPVARSFLLQDLVTTVASSSMATDQSRPNQDCHDRRRSFRSLVRLDLDLDLDLDFERRRRGRRQPRHLVQVRRRRCSCNGPTSS